MAQPTDYSLPGVMRYLQTEWQRNERDRIQWELERAEMKSRIAKLEGEKRGLQLLVESHLKRISELEEESSSDNNNNNNNNKTTTTTTNTEGDTKEEVEEKDVDLSPLIESRQYLEKCIQEVEYLLQSNGQMAGPLDDKKWTKRETFTCPSVKSIKFLSQSKVVLCGDQGIKLWDTAGNCKDIYPEGGSKLQLVNDTAYFMNQSVVGVRMDGSKVHEQPGGTDFAVYSEHQIAVAEGKQISLNNNTTLGVDGHIRQLHFFNESQLIVTFHDSYNAVLIDAHGAQIPLEPSQSLSEASAHKQATSICVVSDTILIGYNDGSIHQYDASGSNFAVFQHGASVTSLCSSSRNFMSASNIDNSVRVWTTSNPKPTDSFTHQGVTGCDWFASVLATCGNNTIQTYIK